MRMYNATTRDKLLVIDIYGDIGADWFGEGITAAAVKKSIDAAKVVDRIQVNINSPGGDAFEGIAIKNLLSKQNVPVAVTLTAWRLPLHRLLRWPATRLRCERGRC